jgi:adenylate cyclase
VRNDLRAALRGFGAVRRLRRLARRFGIARALCVVLLAMLVFVRIADPYLVEELRLRTFDGYQVLDPRIKTARPVTVVDIDEASLAKYGQWPWPRTLVADLASRLTKMGAVVVAFDVLFPEPDRLNPQTLASSLHGLDEDARAKLRALPSNDEAFAAAIAAGRIVVGQSGVPSAVQQGEQVYPQTGVATLGGDPQPSLFQFSGLLRNIPVLENAAAGRGILTIRPERDGILRRVPMVVVAQGMIVPALSFEIIRVLAGSETILIKSDDAGIKSVAVKGFEIATDPNGQLWVHFARSDRQLYVSAADVLDGTASPEMIARKLVLIGTSAAGLLDIKTTPVDRAMAGVEIHAQVIESMLTRAVLSRPNYAIAVELILAVVSALVIIWLAPLLGPRVLAIMGVGVVVLFVAISGYLYAQKQLLFDFTFPLIASSAIYLTLVFGSYVREQKQRRQIRSAFGQYLSPALVEQLAQSPERLVLGGEEREMTFLFSDVRGFTTISESFKNDPQGLTSLMNRFLTPLTNAILARKGTIDKYMGDAIMAFWNAPLDDKAHQINACAAALDMLEQLKGLNEELHDEAEENGRTFMPIRIGIGLNSGVCVVGNLGSDVHFDYSVLGDSVNVASRLEDQTKVYGLPIIVGAQTARAAGGHFAFLEIDLAIVKGKTEPEPFFALLGRKGFEDTAEFVGVRDAMHELLRRYRDQDWTGAAQFLEGARRDERLGQLKMVLDLYSERIRKFRSDPPPGNWNGAYELLEK